MCHANSIIEIWGIHKKIFITQNDEHQGKLLRLLQFSSPDVFTWCFALQYIRLTEHLCVSLIEERVYVFDSTENPGLCNYLNVGFYLRIQGISSS